jgi:hypothetical protein
MKSNSIAICLLIAGVLITLCGCAGTPVTLKSVSAKDIDKTIARPISGEACGFELFMLIPIRTNSRLERAFEELQKNARNDIIADVTIEETWRYGFVGTKYCTILEAKAYQRPASK